MKRLLAAAGLTIALSGLGYAGLATASETSLTLADPVRFADPNTLICPACGDRVQCEAPAYWYVKDGFPAPQFSHLDDSSPLCRMGGVIPNPISVR